MLEANSVPDLHMMQRCIVLAESAGNDARGMVGAGTKLVRSERSRGVRRHGRYGGEFCIQHEHLGNPRRSQSYEASIAEINPNMQRE